MKKLLILSTFIYSILLSLGLCLNEFSALAQEPVYSDSQIKYYYFAEPTSIAANEDGVAILDNNEIKVFDNENEFIQSLKVSNDTFKINYYGKYLFSLSPDGIMRDGKTFVQGEFSDFACSENLLYTVNDNYIYSYLIDNPQSEPATYDIKNYLDNVRYFTIQAITAVGTDIYFSVPGHINKNFSDIYKFDTMNSIVTLLYRQQQQISELAYNDRLIAKINRGIVRFDESFDELIVSSVYEDDELKDLCAYGGSIYTLDLLGTVKSIDSYGTIKTLIASASDAVGFYNMPVSVFTKNHSIIVADFLNNRISVADDNGYKYISDISRPIGAVLNNYNNYYIAHEVNSLSVFDGNLKYIKKLTLPGRIKAISSDSFNHIFAIAEKSLYLIDDDTAAKIPLEFEPNNIYCNSNNGKTYLSSASGIYRLINEDEKWITQSIADVDANIFAVDDEETVFVLKNNRITSYSDNNIGVDIEADEGDSYIYLSTVKSRNIDYGDLLIVNSIKHCLSKIPYSEIGSKSIAHTFENPNINAPIPNIAQSAPIIRMIANDTKLFTAPFDSDVKLTLSKGQRVIVDYLQSTECFSLILYSNALSGMSEKLVYGFVYTESLTPVNYEYAKPTTPESIIYNNNTPVYKYPSVFSPTLKKFQKNDTVKLLDFAALTSEGDISDGYFLDDLDYKWFRIELENGNEGFIIASDLTNNDITKPDIYPQINGSIIEFNGKTRTQIYIYDEVSKNYIPTGDTLEAGTRIEILDLPFDPTVKYCRILYHKEGTGTVECYVLSDFVRYNSKNFAQYIAVIIIVSCVFLGICTFILIKYIKKRRTLK